MPLLSQYLIRVYSDASKHQILNEVAKLQSTIVHQDKVAMQWMSYFRMITADDPSHFSHTADQSEKNKLAIHCLIYTNPTDEELIKCKLMNDHTAANIICTYLTVANNANQDDTQIILNLPNVSVYVSTFQVENQPNDKNVSAESWIKTLVLKSPQEISYFNSEDSIPDQPLNLIPDNFVQNVTTEEIKELYENTCCSFIGKMTSFASADQSQQSQSFRETFRKTMEMHTDDRRSTLVKQHSSSIMQLLPDDKRLKLVEQMINYPAAIYQIHNILKTRFQTPTRLSEDC